MSLEERILDAYQITFGVRLSDDEVKELMIAFDIVGVELIVPDDVGED